jgi:DNA-binding HxlR family transcriptional regulator
MHDGSNSLYAGTMVTERASDAGSPHGACDAALMKAFSFLGKRWNGLILATLASGPASYSDLSRSVTGISASILSDRLAELSAQAIITRTVNDGPPISVTYELTPTGDALIPVLDDLARWAEQWLMADDAVPAAH